MRNLKTLFVLFLFLPSFSYGDSWPFPMRCFDPSELKRNYKENTVFFDSRTQTLYRRGDFISNYQSKKIPHGDLKHFQILIFEESTPMEETLDSLTKLLKDNKSKNYIRFSDSAFLTRVINSNPEHRVCFGNECMLTESLQNDRDYTFLDLNQQKNMKPSELNIRLNGSSLSGYNNIFVFRLKPNLNKTNSPPVEKFVRFGTDGKAYIDNDKVKAETAVKDFLPVKFDPVFCEGTMIIRLPSAGMPVGRAGEARDSDTNR